MNLRDTQGNFRNFGDVLDEIGGKWKSFSNIEQSAIGVAISGVRNRENFNVLMNGYGKALEYAGVSANSSGTAMKKFEAYQDSIEAKSKKLTATLEGLSSTFLDSGLVKGILDIGSSGISGLTTFIDKFGTIPTIVGAATLALGLFNKNIGIFQNQNGQFSILGKTVEEMKQAKSEGQAFGGLFTKQVVQPFANAESVINKYNLGLQHGSITQKGFQSLLDQSDDSLGNYLKNLNGSKASMEGYNKSLKASTVSTKGMALATTLLNAAISMGILIAINLAIKAIQNYINKIDNLKDKVEESANAYKETQSELEDINQKLEDNQKLISDINENPLDYTGDKTLEDLQNQNLELVKQKAILEEISKMKLQTLNQDTENLLNTNNSRASEAWNLIKEKKFTEADNLISTGREDKNNSYKYNVASIVSPILGVGLAVKDLTTETQNVLTETQNSIKSLKNLTVRRNEILADGIISKDEQTELAKINTEYNDLNKTLSENMQLLQDQKNNLNETSGTYKTIQDIENKYLELTDMTNNGDISNGITDEFIKAKNKIEGVSSSDFYGNIGEYAGSFDSINTDGAFNTFEISGNAIEQYDKISAIIDKINAKRSLGNKLTKDEQTLYDDLIKRQTELTNVISGNRETYISGIVSETNFKFQDYMKQNPVDVDNFKAWREELLKIADGNELVKDILQDLINQTFPDEAYQIQMMTDAEKSWYFQQKQNTTQLKETETAIFDLKTAFDTLNGKQTILNTAMQEMYENSGLTGKSYEAITALGEDYAKCLEIQNGKLVLNVKKFKELATQEILNEKQTNNLTIANLQYQASVEAMSGGDISAIQARINELALRNAAINEEINAFNNSKYEPKETSSKTEDLWKQEGEDKLKAIKHQVEMEEITQEEGLNRTEEIYKKYFSDLTKYQDEYNQYEEEVYNGRKELRQKEINDEISYLDEQKKNYEDLSAQLLEDSIKPIDEKIESLKKQNEELDKTNQLLDAQNKLENAKNKSVFTFNGSSWGYQEDTEAVKEAQDNLTKVEKDVEIDNLEKSKKDLEDKSSEAIDVISQFFDDLINVLDGKSPLQSNPEAYKNLQYTPATIDNIGKLNISDEAKKLFGLNIGTNLNGGLKNYTDFSKIGKQFNNTLLPVTNNESQKSLMIEKICDQIVLNDVKNADDFVAQLVNQLPTAISNYLKK